MDISFTADLADFYAGDSVVINHKFNNTEITEANGYLFQYRFTNYQNNSYFDLVYSEEKQSFVLALTPLDSSGSFQNLPQSFDILGILKNETEEYQKTFNVGTVLVKEDLSIVSSKENRTDAERMVEKIKKILLNKGDSLSYSIAGRQKTVFGFVEIRKELDYWQNKVNMEKKLANGKYKNKGNIVEIIWRS